MDRLTNLSINYLSPCLTREAHPKALAYRTRFKRRAFAFINAPPNHSFVEQN